MTNHSVASSSSSSRPVSSSSSRPVSLSSSRPVSSTTTTSEHTRYLVILDELEDMKIQYDGAKRVFRMFLVKSGLDWRGINVFKCCVILRKVLLEANFRIVSTGESVRFEDVPVPRHLVRKKSSRRKISFVKKKKSKSYTFDWDQSPEVDPLVAQLPNTLIQNSTCGRQLLTQDQIDSQKEAANIAINRYTDIVQTYHNYKSLFNAAAEIGPSMGESKYGAILELMQDEVNMTAMVLTGQCCPD